MLTKRTMSGIAGLVLRLRNECSAALTEIQLIMEIPYKINRLRHGNKAIYALVLRQKGITLPEVKFCTEIRSASR
jgi:hypothetical protein